jgi:hypothetical protein
LNYALVDLQKLFGVDFLYGQEQQCRDFEPALDNFTDDFASNA